MIQKTLTKSLKPAFISIGQQGATPLVAKEDKREKEPKQFSDDHFINVLLIRPMMQLGNQVDPVVTKLRPLVQIWSLLAPTDPNAELQWLRPLIYQRLAVVQVV